MGYSQLKASQEELAAREYRTYVDQIATDGINLLLNTEVVDFPGRRSIFGLIKKELEKAYMEPNVGHIIKEKIEHYYILLEELSAKYNNREPMEIATRYYNKPE